MTRDSQKQKCYDWQYKVAGRYPDVLNKRLTLKEAQALTNKICAAHGIDPAPVVQESWGAKKSYYQKGQTKWNRKYGTIKTPTRIRLSTKDDRWGFKLLVVIHEICHALADRYIPKHEGDHGPTYMRLFFDLLLWFGNIDPVKEYELAMNMGVQIAPKINYVLSEPITGIVPIIYEKPKAEKIVLPKAKFKPQVQKPQQPWLRASTEEERKQEFWVRCCKCKELIVFDYQPVGFQWCEKHK